MAYEVKKIENVVNIIPISKFNEIRITQIGDEEIESVDIRQWYCTQKDPEMKPTYKGIRISVDNVQELIDSIKQAVGGV